MSKTHASMLPTPSLETRDLLLVRAIVESGGASRAAQVLHVTQSAVSHQLKSLEERLGVPLFQRRGRTLQLTRAGERLLVAAREVLQPLALAEAEIRAAQGAAPQSLRVSTQCYTAYHWLPRVLPDLLAEFPNVQFQIVTGGTGDVLSALQADEIDLGLCVNAPVRGGLAQHALFRDELVAVVARQHALASRSTVHAHQLAHETLIVYDTVRAERERVQRSLFPNGGGFSRVVLIPSTGAIVELVKAGIGVSIMTGWSVAPYVRAGEVAVLRFTCAGMKRRWFGVHARNSALAGPIRTTLRLIKERGLPR
jgi:LysR family transcriptional regulator for metE and metH